MVELTYYPMNSKFMTLTKDFGHLSLEAKMISHSQISCYSAVKAMENLLLKAEPMCLDTELGTSMVLVNGLMKDILLLLSPLQLHLPLVMSIQILLLSHLTLPLLQMMEDRLLLTTYFSSLLFLLTTGSKLHLTQTTQCKQLYLYLMAKLQPSKNIDSDLLQ